MENLRLFVPDILQSSFGSIGMKLSWSRRNILFRETHLALESDFDLEQKHYVWRPPWTGWRGTSVSWRWEWQWGWTGKEIRRVWNGGDGIVIGSQFGKNVERDKRKPSWWME